MGLSIIISEKRSTENVDHYFFTTCFMRWYAETRDYLFQNIRYSLVKTEFILPGMLPKFLSPIAMIIHHKVFSGRKNLGEFIVPSNEHSIYTHRVASYFVKSFDLAPYLRVSSTVVIGVSKPCSGMVSSLSKLTPSTIWFKETGEDGPRFVTTYPLRRDAND